MSGRIRRCTKDITYTLRKICPVCGRETVIAHPARFSPHDRLNKYRRRVRISTTSL